LRDFEFIGCCCGGRIGNFEEANRKFCWVQCARKEKRRNKTSAAEADFFCGVFGTTKVVP
jgi:hypothetical protein